MLARTALQASRAPLAVASTSRVTLSAPQQRAFSASAPAQESRGKRKTRLVRKANLDKKAQLVREHEQTRPDPVLGYAQGNEDLWNKSLLKQILLRREDVWAGNAQSASGTSSTASAEAVDADTHGYTPELFNFGLDSETAHQLSDVLPATSALRSTLGDQATSVGSVMFSRFEDATRAEQEKRDTLMRIIDLRNADSKGIEVENTRRIVEAFGRVPGDTASPEVQAAILTMRIRSLSAHLISLPRDIQNRQALRLMISRRTRVLKYLRKVSVTRYEDVLDKIGVEPRAVEGEVIITKDELRTMIRGQ
ncbi:hypothetical protein BMF94_3493 [Rhodotorula taiwanensis]|uniref:Ribosomal protein S15 n=1 Tax=Rhodotorula taiwanensis TaxID=741276 RepID=A0A2S5B9V0_9BASI|nr:hypothetical protein BMF94_3493 [Rhodotorula taiwanensis]